MTAVSADIRAHCSSRSDDSILQMWASHSLHWILSSHGSDTGGDAIWVDIYHCIGGRYALPPSWGMKSKKPVISNINCTLQVPQNSTSLWERESNMHQMRSILKDCDDGVFVTLRITEFLELTYLRVFQKNKFQNWTWFNLQIKGWGSTYLVGVNLKWYYNTSGTAPPI